MTDFYQGASKDARVIQLLRLIAEKHNVIVEINPYTREVKFLCSKETELLIAQDIDEYFDCI